MKKTDHKGTIPVRLIADGSAGATSQTLTVANTPQLTVGGDNNFVIGGDNNTVTLNVMTNQSGNNYFGCGCGNTDIVPRLLDIIERQSHNIERMSSALLEHDGNSAKTATKTDINELKQKVDELERLIAAKDDLIAELTKQIFATQKRRK